MSSITIEARDSRDGPEQVDAEEKDAIETAVSTASAMMGDVKAAIDEIWGPASRTESKRKDSWRQNNRFKTWLGSSSLTNYQIGKTRDRIHELRRRVNGPLKFSIIAHQTGRLSYLCHEHPHTGEMTAAYSSPGTPIKLCPAFFGMSTDRQATTVIHEIFHQMGHVHQLSATNAAKARELAKDYPRLARRNPENFEQLAYAYR